ncbi:MAG: hypothetical protein WCL42_05105, partial [Chlorobiaceae bacterium]
KQRQKQQESKLTFLVGAAPTMHGELIQISDDRVLMRSSVSFQKSPFQGFSVYFAAVTIF